MISLLTATAQALLDLGVVVPDLKIYKELHETHAALDQTAGNEAAAGVAVGGFAVDAVHFFGGLGFLVKIQRVAGLHLHARGQFVAGHAGIKPGLEGTRGLVPFVEPGNQVALKRFDGGGLVKGRFQVEHRRALCAETRALVHRRQITGLPVLRAVHGQFVRVLQYDVGGQVLVFRAQSVAHPGAEGRQARQHPA